MLPKSFIHSISAVPPKAQADASERDEAAVQSRVHKRKHMSKVRKKWATSNVGRKRLHTGTVKVSLFYTTLNTTL